MKSYHRGCRAARTADRYGGDGRTMNERIGRPTATLVASS